MRYAGRGIAAALLANLLWGLSPLYYKLLQEMPALELLAHRAVWAFVFFIVLLALQGRLRQLSQGFTRPVLPRMALAAGLITVNWGLMIWAVLEDRATEASLGYFIYPLIAVLMGRILLGEVLHRAQWLALALAALAVTILTLGLGAPPWVALTLASTFAVYALFKKQTPLGPVLSVSTEVVLLLPVFLGVLAWFHLRGAGHFGHDLRLTLLLPLAGPVTAVPLLLFSYAARRVRLSTLGLMQYLNPTLQFLVATTIFLEPLSIWHMVAFPLIWVALGVYSASAWRSDRAARKVSSAVSADAATWNSPRSDGSAKP